MGEGKRIRGERKIDVDRCVRIEIKRKEQNLERNGSEIKKKEI